MKKVIEPCLKCGKKKGMRIFKNQEKKTRAELFCNCNAIVIHPRALCEWDDTKAKGQMKDVKEKI